jgi:thiosulfate/3-mercaptopyruvate sulfurtransferase
MAFMTLIDTETLARELRSSGLAIVDCRFDLQKPALGRQQYLSSHIPTAVYADLDRDLSGEKTGRNGRHPLPEPQALKATLGRLGVDANTQVVAYDQDSGMYASRLWWLLRWMGHRTVAVLDGGFAKWIAEGRPTVAGDEPATPCVFNGEVHPEMTIEAGEVAALTGRPDWRLVDARAPERFRGEVEPIDRVPGHIPGAINHFFKLNLTDEGTFLPPERLHSRLEALTGSVPPDHVVCYCGSGVTACQNLLALEHAGLRGAKLYAGSWSEWSSDPDRAVEKVRR